MSTPTMPTQPVFIKADTRMINTDQIQEIIRMMVGTTPSFKVRMINPNIALTFPQGGSGYTNLTNFINRITPTSAFMDLGSTVINLKNVFAIQRIADDNQPPNLGYRIRFWTGERDEDLVFFTGTPEYDLLFKRFGL